MDTKYRSMSMNNFLRITFLSLSVDYWPITTFIIGLIA